MTKHGYSLPVSATLPLHKKIATRDTPNTLKPLFRNIFLLFGIAAIVVMLCKFPVNYSEIGSNIRLMGLYLPAVIGVWIFVYAFNAWAFQIIVNNGTHDKHLSFRHAYKLTVSGFAFSYTTPFGFGGGPYRVMELSAFIGVPRAMSSVVLYSMMHILSHICLWSTAVVVFALAYTEKMTPFLWCLFAGYFVVLLAVLFVFNICYKKGVIVKLFTPLLHVPFAKKWARKFYDKNIDSMRKVDENIAYLRSQPRAFWLSLLFEYIARVINSLEYYFILLSLGVCLDFWDALLVLAFSSLIGNLLFFLPMQLGAREGGLSAIVKILGLSAPGIGVLTSLYTRIRELVWIFIGVGLVKIGNKNIMRDGASAQYDVKNADTNNK